MGRARLLNILTFGILAISAILAWVLFTPREQPVPFELSPEEMRMPLRLITIAAPYASRAAMLTQLQAFGNDVRFGIHIAQPATDTQTTTIAAYRSDITFRGTLSADSKQLQLAVYRTFGRASRPAIDHGVNGLRDAFSALPRARFTHTVLVRGDDARLDTRSPISADRAVNIEYPDTAREEVQRRIIRFASANNLSVRTGQLSADPREYAITMYGDGIALLGNTTSKKDVFGITAYRTGDRSAPLALFDQLFEALRRLVEEIDGVKFADHPLQR